MTSPARSAVDLGRSATQDDDDANTALVRVVYCEGGADALRRYLESSHLEQSTHAIALFEAAYGRMLLGDAATAKELIARASVLAMLDQMIAAGVERYATYELRAKVYALEGRGDDAMRDLGKAAKLGWRRTWWAIHAPYFASLQPRSDFQALIAQVSRSNDRLTEDMKLD